MTAATFESGRRSSPANLAGSHRSVNATVPFADIDDRGAVIGGWTSVDTKAIYVGLFDRAKRIYLAGSSE